MEISELRNSALSNKEAPEPSNADVNVRQPVIVDSLLAFNNRINEKDLSLPPSFKLVYINTGKSKGSILMLGNAEHIPFYLFENTKNELELYPGKMIQSVAGREYYSKVFAFEPSVGKQVKVLEPCRVADRKSGYFDLIKAGKITFINS